MKTAAQPRRARNEIVQSVRTLQNIAKKHSLALPSDYYFVVAQAMLDSGDRRTARQYFRKGLREDRSNVEAWLDLAQTYFDSGRPSHALRAINRALQNVGDNPDLWIMRGIALDKMGESRKAMKCYDHSSVARSTSKSVQYLRLRNRAIALMNLGRAEEAIRDLEKAYRLESDPAILVLLGDVCLDANRLREALKYAALAVKRDPELAWAWNTIGIVRALREDYKKAILAFGRSTHLQPKEVRFLLNLSHAHLDMDRFADARRYAEKAAELDPKSTDAYLLWARALVGQGKRQEAVRILERGSSKARGKATLRETVARVRRGESLPDSDTVE